MASSQSANPSRACKACRTAKVQCDLIRPVCGRCSRRRTPCDWLEEDTPFLFRNQNADDIQRAIKRRTKPVDLPIAELEIGRSDNIVSAPEQKPCVGRFDSWRSHELTSVMQQNFELPFKPQELDVFWIDPYLAGLSDWKNINHLHHVQGIDENTSNMQDLIDPRNDHKFEFNPPESFIPCSQSGMDNFDGYGVLDRQEYDYNLSWLIDLDEWNKQLAAELNGTDLDVCGYVSNDRAAYPEVYDVRKRSETPDHGYWQ